MVYNSHSLVQKPFKTPHPPPTISTIYLQSFIAKLLQRVVHISGVYILIALSLVCSPCSCFCLYHSSNDILVMGSSEMYPAQSNGHFSALRVSVVSSSICHSWSCHLSWNSSLGYLTWPKPNWFLNVITTITAKPTRTPVFSTSVSSNIIHSVDLSKVLESALTILLFSLI